MKRGETWLAEMAAALADIVGADAIRPATPSDAIDGVQPALVVEPATVESMSRALAWADERGLKVAPRGGGTRMGWGNRPTGVDLVLSTMRLSRLIEHADGDMTATVEAGLTLNALQAELAKAGQKLMLDVPTPEQATIGGLIAVNDSGALRLRYGGIRDLLLGVTFVRADGVVAHGGGRVVKNVAGYDLPKLLTGSFGTLGVITQATFRLHPLPSTQRTVVVDFDDLEAANGLVLDVWSSSLVPIGLTLEAAGEAGVRVHAELAGLEASVAAQAEALRTFIARRGGSEREELDAESNVTRSAPRRVRRKNEPALVLKMSVLPSEIGAAVTAVRENLRAVGAPLRVTIHAHGLGLAHMASVDSADVAGVVDGIEALRERLAERDGTAMVLEAPLTVKERLDVFGMVSDALPLMRRVKAELDPRGTLNPGRFVGRI